MSLPFLLKRLLIAACVALLLSSLAYAQVATVNDTTSTPIPGAGHDYIHLLSETVNPANGSVSMRIEIPMPKGRGISIPFSFGYDSNSAHHLQAETYPNYGKASWTSNNDAFAQGGWSNSFPTVRSDTWEQDQYVLTGVNQGQPVYTAYPCYYAANYIFRDLSGAVHALNLGALSWSSGAPPPNGCPGVPAAGGGDAQFGASLTTNSQSGMVLPSPVTVSDNAGTTYVYTGYRGSCSPFGSCFGSPDYIEDRNGNKVVLTQNGITDTLGRPLISGTGLGASGTTQTVSIFGGLNYSLTWTSASANFQVPYAYVGNNVGPNSVSDTCYSAVPPANDTQTVVSQITLPNGKQFHFYYGTDNPNPSFQNPYGLLSEIDYPSGAWVKYTWKLSDTMNEVANYPGAVINNCGNGGPSYCPSPVNDGCVYQYASPVVASRQFGFIGSPNPVLTQTFTYSTSWAAPTSGNVGGTSWTQKTTRVTTTDNVTGKSALTAYSYTPIALPNPPFNYTTIPAQVPAEATTAYYDWGNTTKPIRTVNKTWYDQFNIASQQTVLETGQTSKITYCYVGSNCVPNWPSQLQEEDEYDFGATSPTRRTVTTYQAFPGTPGIIADDPCKIDVYGAGSSPIAESQYFYDGGSTLCGTPGTPSVAAVANLPSGTHDETTFGPSSSTSRGNLTKLTKLCIPNCTSSPTTAYTYDETGQVLTMTDACGNATCSDMTATSHTTMYSYADNFDSPPSGNTNAYLTQITDPLGHISKFKYAYPDGQLIQSQDQNDINASRPGTTYFYADPLRRLTETDYPDGGKTTISYNDAAPSPSVTTSRLMATSAQTPPTTTTLTTTTTTDGIGHVVENLFAIGDQDCTTGDRTDTTYDGFGRVNTMSNPYCTTSDPTYGLTSYTYDALGRTTIIKQPDGWTALRNYHGNLTEVSDEGNGTQRIQRMSQTDALGRTTSVCEEASAPFIGAGGASSNSLIGSAGTPVSCASGVSATGFVTTYQYDALDNLLQVSQSGIAPRAFAYDSLSRLTSATNPESGTISYAYDANGNLTTKTAPAPNQTGSATVTTTYAYDALNRLTQKSYSDGTTPTMTYYYDADPSGHTRQNPVGRMTEWATVNCLFMIYDYDPMGRVLNRDEVQPSNCYAGHPISNTYDLMGNMTSQTDGQWHTATYTYNTAGRITNVTDSQNNPSAGQPPNLFSPGSCSKQYDAAGRLLCATTGYGEVESYTYDKRGRQTSSSIALNGVTIYSFNITSFAPNGNVLAVNDSSNGNWTYAYDSFNRLTCANLASNGTCSAPTSGTPTYSYVYDRFGNRWQQNGPHAFTATFTGNNPSNPANNNRIDGYAYDSAGNLINDGVHTYTYDAENRIIQVDAGNTAIYTYDGEGHRFSKDDTTSVNHYPPDPQGTTEFVYDPQGHLVHTEAPNAGTGWRGEVFLGNRHLATYVGNVVFNHSDWLGTERHRDSVPYGTNQIDQQFLTSLPFGDWLDNTQGFVPEGDPLNFTGQYHDFESDLDYFGARYFGSSMGRWLSPDRLNVTDDRLEIPSNSLNKYVYGANNPFHFVDPDGRDIVALYDPPHGVRPGHFMLFANNPQTGESAMMSFGPRDQSAGGTAITAVGGSQESTKTYDWPQSADDLRQNFAALSIQTTPEQAQEVINFIKNLDPSNTDYKLLSQNCTTVCRDALKIIGLVSKQNSNITPAGFWDTLYSRYGRKNFFQQMFAPNVGPRRTGIDYGSPRFGMNTFDFLWLQLKPRACTTIQGPNGPETNCVD